MTSLEVREEKHPGVDDVHLLSVDGSEFHVDASVGQAVDEEADLRKRAWSSSLHIGQALHRLSPSVDARGMFVAMPVLLLVLGVLLGTRTRQAPLSDAPPSP